MRICKLVRRNCDNYKPLLYKYLFSSVQLLVYSVLIAPIYSVISRHEFHAISITAIRELLQCNLLLSLDIPLQCFFLFELGELKKAPSAVTEAIPHISKAIGKKTMNRIILMIPLVLYSMFVCSLYKLD